MLFGKNVKRIKLFGSGFGANGPTLIFRTDLSGSTVGSAWTTTDYEGSGSVATAAPASGDDILPIHEVSTMPGGRAMAIGASGTDQNSSDIGKIIVTTGGTPSADVYEHYALQWPSAQQLNSEPDFDASCIWQSKQLWHLYEDGAAGKVAWHAGFGAYFSAGYFLVSSLVSTLAYGTPAEPTADKTTHYPGFLAANDSDFVLAGQATSHPRVRTTPFIAQNLSRNDTGTEGAVHMYIRHHDDNVVGVSHTTGISNHEQTPSPAHAGPDRFNFPGFVRGFKIDDDQQFYMGDIYVAHGAGAFARVEITNHATYESATIVSPATIVSWSDTEIVCDVKKGAFSWLDDEDPYPTLYVTIHDADNTHISTSVYTPWWV